MRPWTLVHRGRVLAAGLWIDRAWVPPARAAQRVLQLWADTDALFETERGWLVRFGAPRAIEADGPGLPLTEREGRLVAAPLRDEEWEDRPAGGWLQVRGGELESGPLGSRVDPADWLVLELPVAQVTACAPPPPPPRPVLPREPMSRASFGVDDLAPEARELLRDLVRPASDDRAPEPPPAASRATDPPSPPSFWERLGGWFSSPPDAATPASPSTAPPPGPARGRASMEPPAPGFLQGLSAFFGQLFGGDDADREARDEQRLQEMLARFDGNLEEALRHAIPLGGQGGLHRSHPAWQRLAPRDRLTPGLGGGGASSSSIGAGPDLYELLRETYRRAAEQLVEAGEIEKAAFVYADLLGDLDRALELLEEHGLYRLAARLAESRELEPARVARLYVLAGDLGRALRIANIERIFGQLIASFEGEDDVMLRAAYAAHLVNQDRYAAAVQVLWGTRLRPATRPWVLQLVERQGQGSGEALVQLEQLDAGLADATLGRWLSGRPDPSLLRELAVAMADAGGPRRWGRRLVRRLWGLDGEPGLERALSGLLQWVELADLRADAPFLTARPGEPGRLTLPASFAGGVPIRDVAWVPDGTLCALGEGGLVKLDLAGRPVWRDPTPCTWLVTDEEGFRCIGLHPAGSLHRVLRIDLRTRTVRLWLRTRLVAWSPTSIAGQWLIHDGEHPMVVDTSVRDASWRWIWQGPRLDAPVVQLHQERERAHIAIGAPVGQVFTYDDTWFMRGRTALAGADAAAFHQGTTSSLEGRQLFVGGRRAELVGEPLSLVGTPRGPWVATRTAAGIDVRAPLSPGGPSVGVPDARGVGLRVHGDEVCVFDDQGRLVWIDVGSGHTRGPWRVV